VAASTGTVSPVSVLGDQSPSVVAAAMPGGDSATGVKTRVLPSEHVKVTASGPTEHSSPSDVVIDVTGPAPENTVAEAAAGVVVVVGAGDVVVVAAVLDDAGIVVASVGDTTEDADG
jgi:hypothetical protein